MSADQYNRNVCNRFVINQESMDQFWNFEEPEGLTYKYDPTWSIILMLEWVEDEEERDRLDALEQGDVRSVAECRAEYDLNGLSGGFCCQMLA